jgi:hypothetical protein
VEASLKTLGSELGSARSRSASRLLVLAAVTLLCACHGEAPGARGDDPAAVTSIASSRLKEVCPGVARDVINVRATDAVTGQPICDLDVTATDDGGSKLELSRDPSCVFRSYGGKEGTFTVSASKKGYVTESRRVAVKRVDACTLEAPPVQIALRPG